MEKSVRLEFCKIDVKFKLVNFVSVCISLCLWHDAARRERERERGREREKCSRNSQFMLLFVHRDVGCGAKRKFIQLAGH